MPATRIEGCFPLDKELALSGRPGLSAARAIYQANVDLLDRADIVIANLTPFRGPSMDVGTAFEIGFADARGKKVFGYANVSASLVERVVGESGGSTRVRFDAGGLPVTPLEWI